MPRAGHLYIHAFFVRYLQLGRVGQNDAWGVCEVTGSCGHQGAGAVHGRGRRAPPLLLARTQRVVRIRRQPHRRSLRLHVCALPVCGQTCSRRIRIQAG